MDFKILENMKLGTLELLLTKSNEGKKKQYVFIKDEKYFLDQIGSCPIIESKCIVFDKQNCIPLLLMFRFNNDDNLIYSKWINYCDFFGKERVQRLMFDSTIDFCLVDQCNNKFSTFEIENQIAFTIKNYIKIVSKKYWTEQSFLDLINKINSKAISRVMLFNDGNFTII